MQKLITRAAVLFATGLLITACGGGGGGAATPTSETISDADLTLPSQLEVVTYEGGD